MSAFICRSCANSGVDMFGNACACQRKRPGSDTSEAKLRQREQIAVERERRASSDLSMMDVTRYVDLHHAHELAVRQNELYEAMLLVEQCGASPELTEAINKLGERMRHIQADLVSACKSATGVDASREPEPCPMCKGLGAVQMGPVQTYCLGCNGTGKRRKLA